MARKTLSEEEKRKALCERKRRERIKNVQNVILEKIADSIVFNLKITVSS